MHSVLNEIIIILKMDDKKERVKQWMTGRHRRWTLNN